MKTTLYLQCSKCGKSQAVSLNAYKRNALVKVATRWSNHGSALHCTACTKEYGFKPDPMYFIENALMYIENQLDYREEDE